MESAATRTPHRVLRVLLASGLLALGWVAVDLVAHSEPAAAAETIDLLPLVDDTTETVTTTVESVVTPLVTTVTAPVQPLVSAVVSSPVVTEVVAPAVEPIVVPIVDIAEPVIAPILLPIVEVVTVVDVVAPIAAEVAFAVENEPVLIGSALVVGSLLAASIAPLRPVPTNGAPRNVPEAPAGPSSPTSSMLLAIDGELNSGVGAVLGALRSGNAPGSAMPASPTFAFDTTPD